MSTQRSLVRSTRYTPEEWARVEGWAAAARVEPSRYVRETVLERRPQETLRGVRAEAVRELSAVGQDLGRLVHLAHQARADRAAGRGADPALGGADGTVTPQEVEACLANVLAAVDRVSPPRKGDPVFIASDMEPGRPNPGAAGPGADRGRP